MRVGNPAKAVAVLLLVAVCAAVRIEKGWVTLEAVTADNNERFKVDLHSQLKQELNLTQSSRLNIEAKVTHPPRSSPSPLMISSLSSSLSACVTQSTTT